MLRISVGLLLLFGGFFQTELQSGDAVDLLLKMEARIAADSATARPELQQKTLRGWQPPVLDQLDKVKLGMHQNEVLSQLSTPTTKHETDTGESWLYGRANNRVLSIGFDRSGDVTYIASDAVDISIPRDLRTGMLLEQFERTYGGPELRSSERLGLDRRLVKYPLSHLALIVSSEGSKVESLLVFK